MKNVIGLFVFILFITSCGNKLYSYRKTVRVKGEVAKLDKKTAAPKVYITVREVKPAAKVTTPTPTTAALEVNHNTIYLTSKPAQGTEENASTVSMPAAHYSATIR